MRIGIVTDIHDEFALLAQALAALASEGVDAIVTLGDNTDLFGRWNAAPQVAALLREAGAVGVWGNHDIGLCREVTEETRARLDGPTVEFFATLKPRLELGGCHFSHVEPFLNPEDPAELWTFEGHPEEPERVARSFAAVPHRITFFGHFHRWLAVTESGPFDWDGTTPLRFAAEKRYLVVVAPLFRGAFAVLDTVRWVLEPHNLPLAASQGESADEGSG
jgi:predicted phosphodiesterase